LSTDALNQIRHPISRWYLLPAVERLAVALVNSRVRPGHLTVCGLLSAMAAVCVLLFSPQLMPLAAVLTLAAWFFDRADGRLARLQNTATRWGAWLDANVDELVDLGLHAAIAAVAARQMQSDWPWLLLVGFLFGKYLLMHGLGTEKDATGCETGVGSSNKSEPESRVRKLYHLPGNTDVRVHLLIAAMLSGWLVAELALVAVYYNLRWMVRYLLVAKRLRGAA
jgi:phosphatidylglycerophosphate synthase